jgi:hypothetical protein
MRRPADLGLSLTTLKIGNYNAAIGQLVQGDPTGGAFNVNLPAAIAGSGPITIVNQSDSPNAITVVPNGFDTIKGVGSQILLQARDSIQLFSDGVSDWMAA